MAFSLAFHGYYFLGLVLSLHGNGAWLYFITYSFVDFGKGGSLLQIINKRALKVPGSILTIQQN